MNNYDLILQDVQRNNDDEIVLLPLHNIEEDPKLQVKFLVRQLRRAKSMNNRKEMLLNAWYIGEVIETRTTTLTERTLCLKILSQYYQKVVIRLYYIFEFLGAEQIERSMNTTLTMISKLNNSQYVNL